MLLRLQNTASSMTEMGRLQDRTANNLANANTVGFKKDRTFTAALNERLDEELAPRSDRRANQWVDLSAGPIEQTENPLDLAIATDNVFFTVTDAAGQTRYTRAGNLRLDPDGVLRLPSGLTLMGQNGPLTMPLGTQSVEVTKDGQVRADGQPVERLALVTLDDPTQLIRLDGTTFAPAPGYVPQPAAEALVEQGFLEMSNVSPVGEMTGMIGTLRLFETQQKMIQTTDQVLGQITRDLGKF